MFNGKTHYKLAFSIVMLNYQRVRLTFVTRLAAHLLASAVVEASRWPSLAERSPLKAPMTDLKLGLLRETPHIYAVPRRSNGIYEQH